MNIIQAAGVAYAPLFIEACNEQGLTPSVSIQSGSFHFFAHSPIEGRGVVKAFASTDYIVALDENDELVYDFSSLHYDIKEFAYLGLRVSDDF